MQTTRRAFLKWTAIWGLVPFVGTGLFAESAWLEAETIGSIHMDAPCKLKQATHGPDQAGTVYLKREFGTCRYAFPDYRKNICMLTHASFLSAGH